MFKLPQTETNRWVQANNGSLFGTLERTRNIRLDIPGILQLNKRSRSIYDDTIDADLGSINAIVHYDASARYYIVTSEKLFYMDDSSLVVTEDANAGVPTLGSQSVAVAWQGRLYVSGSTDLKYWDSSSWSTADAGASAGPLAVFKNKNALAASYDAGFNEVALYNTSHSIIQTLVLSDEYSITSMAWANNYLYIGTRHNKNGEALLFLWDGNSSSANAGYGVGANRIDSVKAYKDSVALMTSDGQLLRFNGGGFDVLGSLPAYYSDLSWDVGSGASASSGNVHPNGMVVESDLIFIRVNSLFNGESTLDQLSPVAFNSFPSGVWCYDPEVGLYHFASVSGSRRLKTNTVSTGSVNTTTNIITVGGQTVPETGTPVMYDDGANGVGTGITISTGNLDFRKVYYVIYQSDTTMKLATTYENAVAETAIDITGTGNNSQYFIFLPNRDFGGVQNVSSGAIARIGIGSGFGIVRTDGMRLLFGGRAGTTTITTIPTLNTLAEGQENRGDFITPRLNSSVIEDTFQNITLKFNNVETVEDKIIVKYRTVEREDKLKINNLALKQTGTWVDANTFTSTDVNLADAVVGDEVEITKGSGAGYTAHITSISSNAGTYTINIDEDIQGITASETFLYFIDNWNKLGTITTDDCDKFTDSQATMRTGTGGAKTFSLDSDARWIQIKVELRGEDVQIEELLINNVPLKTFTV